MYVERTNYYAKPGRAADVLAIRRRACQVRVELGLPAGTVFVKQEAGGDGPDVAWECHFRTRDEHKQDLAARDGSDRFHAVREEMGKAIRHFERHFMRRAVDAEAAGWAGDVKLDGVPIAPRRITFTSGRYELRGFLFLPPGDGPFPCMMFNHGSSIHQGSTDLCKPSVAATLLSWGLAAFMPHRHGYGESPGPPWRDEVMGEFGSEAYDVQLAARLDRESDDVVAALAYLQTRPEIQAEHIGVMGSSFGGINTLLAASKTDRFRCAVEFAGAAMNWERTPALRKLMHAAARQLTRPIFFIQAENDYSTAPTRELTAALAGSDLVVLGKVFPAFGLSRDEGHRFERNGPMIWGPEVRSFLERWL